MFTRIRHRRIGDRVYMHFEVGAAGHLPLSKAGTLVVDHKQFIGLRVGLERLPAELVEEKPTEESRGVESFRANPSPVS